MKTIVYLCCALLVISCGTQQKTVNSTQENPEINPTMVDSVNAQFDKPAKRDSLNSTNEAYTDGYITDDGESVTIEFVPTRNYFNHTNWNDLLKKHVSSEGNVDYIGFQDDQNMLQKYIQSLGKNLPNDSWSKEGTLAYWINTYNALTVDLILRNYPTKSIKDISKPWNQRLWKLGEKWYNLDEIEHKILRKMDEPRIHFAINCASFSCPPLLNEAFTEEKLAQQLTQVTKAFLADTQRNTITADAIEISKIFKWFAKDFKQNGSLIDFLNQYSEIKINANAKKRYKDYDWTLNE